MCMNVPNITGYKSPLKLSVISSSTEDMDLSKIFEELWLLRTYAVDFYPRGYDIKESGICSNDELENATLLKRLCDFNNVDKLATYINRQKEIAAESINKLFNTDINADLFVLPALATFFPEIASTARDGKNADEAGIALANAVRLAAKIKAKVVEFVAGRTVERCENKPTKEHAIKCDRILKFKHNETIDRVVSILDKHVKPALIEVQNKYPVRLAAEIEPGFSYSLNNFQHVDYFLKRLEDVNLNELIGLNLDVGHLIILNNSPVESDHITPHLAKSWIDKIYHAHISDNIGYHFRDLVPGSFHDLQGAEDDNDNFANWVKLCLDCAKENNFYSGYLAVELEGCSRIQWVQRSLLRLGYLIRNVTA